MFDGSRYAIVLGEPCLAGSDTLAPLHRHPLLDAVTVAATPEDLFGFVGRHGPAALAVVDLRAAPGGAIELATRLRRTWPSTGVLVVGELVDPRASAALLAHGATVMPCASAIADGASAISATLAGSRPIAPRAGSGLDGPWVESPIEADEIGLSARQAQVLWFMLHGASNKRIAHRLALSEATVKEHVSAILRRLSVRSRIEAVARLRGWRLMVPGLNAPDDSLDIDARRGVRSRSTPSRG